MSADLIALAMRCEAASPAHGLLDLLEMRITEALGFPVGKVATSLDAATALCERLLPGWSWELYGACRQPVAVVESPTGTYIDRRAATPALALTAAVLRGVSGGNA